MKVGDIVKFKRGRSYYERRGYGYVAHRGYPYPDHFRTIHIPLGDDADADRKSGYVDKPFPTNMRGKLAIITKMHSSSTNEGYNEAPDGAIEVCMITHDPYGNGDKIIPLPHARVGADIGGTYGFIEGDDLEVISSGKR
jgi:hypothetical protein